MNEIFQENYRYIKSLAADALAPCIPSTSPTMINQWFSSTKDDLNDLHHLSFEKCWHKKSWHKMNMYFFFSWPRSCLGNRLQCVTKQARFWCNCYHGLGLFWMNSYQSCGRVHLCRALAETEFPPYFMVNMYFYFPQNKFTTARIYIFYFSQLCLYLLMLTRSCNTWGENPSRSSRTNTTGGYRGRWDWPLLWLRFLGEPDFLGDPALWKKVIIVIIVMPIFVCFSLFYAPLFLKHWGRDKMYPISQTTFFNEFSWMKMYEFGSKFHSSLSLRF